MNQAVSFWSLDHNPLTFWTLGAIAPLAFSGYAASQWDGNFGVLPLRGRETYVKFWGKEGGELSPSRGIVLGYFSFSTRVSNV